MAKKDLKRFGTIIGLLALGGLFIGVSLGDFKYSFAALGLYLILLAVKI